MGERAEVTGEANAQATQRPEEGHATPLTVLGLIGATAGWGVGATMTRLAVEEVAPLTTTCLRFGLGALLLVFLKEPRLEAEAVSASPEQRLHVPTGVHRP